MTPAVGMGRGDHSRITVGNLSWSVTEEELKPVMEKFGTVLSITIPRDRRRNNKSKGLAIVDFEKPEEADKAYDELHEKDLLGRRCYITFDDKVQERDRDARRRRERDDRDMRSRRSRRRSDYSDYDSPPPRRSRYRDYSPPPRRSRYRDYDYSRRRWRDRDDRRDRRSRHSDSDDSS